jgi:ATP-binding cassette subfamily F protein 3
MLLQPTNLLVMDEPTNHLDLRSKAVLQEALLAYEGSFVIVSHDRDFLDPLVNKVVEFKGGHLRVFPGTVSDYQHKRRMEQQSAAAPAAVRATPAVGERERKRLEAQIRQERYARTRPLQESIARLEKSIEEGERKKAALEAMLADPEVYRDGERAKNLNAEYKEIGKRLLDEYYQWGEMTKDLERVNASFEEKVRR